MSGLKKLFNTREAAEYLNLKKQTLYNWRHERKGPDYTMIGSLAANLRKQLKD